MSVSQHPIALRLERQVGGATKLLATVMGLPLVDGIFPALVIAGAISSPVGVLQTGLLIFGGSATVAVVLAEMDGSRREQATSILLLGAVLVPVAVVEAAFAETLASMLQFEVFHRIAGVVILAIAAKTASAEVGRYLPSPGIIVGLGLVASFQPGNFQFEFSLDATTLGYAAAAAGTGVLFALCVALAAPQLRGAVDVDRFRFGSAVALGMLALDVLELLPTQQPVALGVLAVTALFAYDPSGASSLAESGGDTGEPAQATAVTDGGDEDPESVTADADATPDIADDETPTAGDDETTTAGDDAATGPAAGPERPPYL